MSHDLKVQRGAVGSRAVTIVGLIIGLALFAASLYFMGSAFDPAISETRAVIEWSSAMILMGLAFGVPIHIIAKIDGQSIKVE